MIAWVNLYQILSKMTNLTERHMQSLNPAKLVIYVSQDSPSWQVARSQDVLLCVSFLFLFSFLFTNCFCHVLLSAHLVVFHRER